MNFKNSNKSQVFITSDLLKTFQRNLIPASSQNTSSILQNF